MELLSYLKGFIYSNTNVIKDEKNNRNDDKYIIISKHKKNISKILRSQVWVCHVGEKFKTLCLCCKFNQIDVFTFECGHVVAESKGGETHCDNLRPICRTCNASMGTENMADFIQKCGFNKSSKTF